MEIIFDAVKIIIPVTIIIKAIICITKIRNSTDLDKAFFTNVEKKMSEILNLIIVFFSNIFIILSLLVLLYNRFVIPAFIKTICDVIMCLIGIILIIALIKPDLKIKNFQLNNFIIRYDRKIISYILFFSYTYAVVLILNIALPTNLIGFNALAITMVSIICSLVSLIFVGIIRDITKIKGKKAKFYFYRKLKDNEKYFIYYSKDKDNVVCGENEDFELADKVVIVPLAEIEGNYPLFRVKND